MSAILEVRNLVKNYGDFQAVKGVSFEIEEGEIFSLLGPKGAGKTTTVSMLSTLYTPTSGDASMADIRSQKTRWVCAALLVLFRRIWLCTKT